LPVVGRISNLVVTVGGQAHSGWLPPGASLPPPTPERHVPVTLTIDMEDDGYLLIAESSDGSVRGDSWHATFADAQRQAESCYGVPVSAWPASTPAAG
jgi:hypothetical protein